MPWTHSAEGKLNNGKYSVYSQTLVTKEGGNGAEGTNWSSVIDFVPPGTDFAIIANTAATNTSTTSPLMLYIGYSRSAAIAYRYRRNETPFISLTSEIDTSTKVHTIDVSSKGQYPYYWLKVPTGGGNVNIKVIVGKGSTEVV